MPTGNDGKKLGAVSPFGGPDKGLGAALQPYGGLVCRRSSADFCRAEKKLLKRKSLARSFCSDFTREFMSSDLFAGRFSMTLSAVLVVDLVNSI